MTKVEDFREYLSKSMLDELFTELKSFILNNYSNMYNDIILISSRYYNTEKSYNQGLISYEEKVKNQTPIFKSLTCLIAEIETKEKEKKHIHTKLQEEESWSKLFELRKSEALENISYLESLFTLNDSFKVVHFIEKPTQNNIRESIPIYSVTLMNRTKEPLILSKILVCIEHYSVSRLCSFTPERSYILEKIASWDVNIEHTGISEFLPENPIYIPDKAATMIDFRFFSSLKGKIVPLEERDIRPTKVIFITDLNFAARYDFYYKY